MIRSFFTADNHFSHFSIIRYTNRPFQTAEEMDKIYALADQMDRLRETEPKENIQWSEDDLIDLFGKKTIH